MNKPKKGKLFRKITSKRGESFAEILIAILIVAFGCALIAVMYTSALNLNLNAAEQDEAFYDALSKTEQMASGTPSAEGNVVLEDEKGGELSVRIEIYGDGTNAAYKRYGH